MTKSLIPTEMPEIDHCVSQGFQGIVQPTDVLETNEQTPKLIFLSEHSLDSVKPFLKNSRVQLKVSVKMLVMDGELVPLSFDALEEAEKPY